MYLLVQKKGWYFTWRRPGLYLLVQKKGWTLPGGGLAFTSSYRRRAGLYLEEAWPLPPRTEEGLDFIWRRPGLYLLLQKKGWTLLGGGLACRYLKIVQKKGQDFT